MNVSEPLPCASSQPASLLSRRDLVPLGVLLALLIALFWRVLFTSDMFFYRDVFAYTFPRAEFVRRTLRSGHLPLWNPAFSFGEPALANPNYLFFYPSTLLLILLPAGYAYCLHYVLHWALGGLGAYGLARRWDQSRLAAFFAAAAFTFSGPVLSLGNFYNQAAAAAWIPWALLSTDRARESQRRRSWIQLTAIFALQFLAAEPLTLFTTFAVALAYALSRCGRDRRRGWEWATGRMAGAFVVVGILMLLLGAAQLLPSLDVLRRSRRGAVGLPFNEVTYWSLHPLSLIEMVIPNFFGSVFDSSTLWTFVLGSRNQPYYASVFMGFVPLFLAGVGAAASKNPRRRFVAGTALLLLFLGFGRFTPLFAETYLLVPLLHVVRFPAKFAVPMTLMVALLAGWGVDALRQADSRPSRLTVLLPLGAVLTLATAAWTLAYVRPEWIIHAAASILVKTNSLVIRDVREQLPAATAVASAQEIANGIRLLMPELIGFSLGATLWMISIDRGRAWARRAVPYVLVLGLARLAVVNYNANPTVPKIFYTYRPAVVEQPSDPAEPYRFSHLIGGRADNAANSGLRQFLSFDNIPGAGRLSPLEQAAFRDRLLLRRGGMLAGVEMAQNLDMEGALPASLYEFWIYELEQAPDRSRADCLLGRANVKYIVRDTSQPSATVREVSTVFNGSPEPSYVYETLCYQPRAFLTDEAIQSASAAETLAKLSDPTFDADRIVILNADPPEKARSTSVSGRPAAPPASVEAPAGQVQILDRRPDSVTVRATLSRPAYLVLLDRWDPNWRASLDGHAVGVLQADWLFRAVRVPSPGTHVIRFSYHQKGLALGGAVSLVTIILSVWFYRRD